MQARWTGFGDDVLEVNAFQFTSRTDLSFIGSDDKDVNVNFTGGSGNDTLTTGKITEDAGDTLTGGLGVDTFHIIASDEPAVVTDLGTGGSDILIVKSTAKGVIATVKDDYIASPTTNNEKALADVVLNAERGVDITMVSAIGGYGYVVNGGSSSSTLEGSNFSDSISGNTSHDKLIGNAGNDTFIGNGGNDTIFAGTGDDVIKLATGELVDGIELSGSSGTDKLLLTLGEAAYTGTLDQTIFPTLKLSRLWQCWYRRC